MALHRLRLEFTKGRSPDWFWILRLCKQQPSYKVVSDQGLEVHSVEFDADHLQEFEAIYQKIGAWKTAALYYNDRLISMSRYFSTLYWAVRGAKIPLPPEEQIKAELLNRRLRSIIRPGEPLP